jgi:hypothetical protein
MVWTLSGLKLGVRRDSFVNPRQLFTQNDLQPLAKSTLLFAGPIILETAVESPKSAQPLARLAKVKNLNNSPGYSEPTRLLGIFNFHYSHQWITHLFGAQLRFLGLNAAE